MKELPSLTCGLFRLQSLAKQKPRRAPLPIRQLNPLNVNDLKYLELFVFGTDHRLKQFAI